MTVCLTAVWNGTVVARRGGTQYGREESNIQKIARKRENSGSKRRHVGENEVLGVGQEKGEMNEE